ncbi:MAG: hypothetical protein H6624_04030 [Bdellovibrionaceae bacterium]|nr:hypothetical protein [Bdellovibrionales bacterium]MCB9083483.1 hypothetical protein [Pseudobdellovibrionaceae bacterium]
MSFVKASVQICMVALVALGLVGAKESLARTQKQVAKKTANRLASPRLRLLSHAEFRRLSRARQVQYLVGLRLMFQDWEKWQRDNRNQIFAGVPSRQIEELARLYSWLVPQAEAKIDPRGDVDEEEARRQRLKDLTLVPADAAIDGTLTGTGVTTTTSAPTTATGEVAPVGEADWKGVRAGPEERACIYAGWIQAYAANGTNCSRPPECKGQAGHFQCNPLLVGPGVCVPGRSREERIRATTTCLKSGKSVEEVAALLKDKKTEWDEFVARFQSATLSCQDGKQQEVCWIIQRRLTQLNKLLGGEALPELVKVPAGGFTAKAPVVASAAVKDVTVSEGAAEVVASTGDRGGRVVATGPSATANHDGVCKNNDVIGDMSLPDKEGPVVMDVNHAYNMVCRGSYERSYVDGRKALVRSRIASLGSRQDAEARYYRDWFKYLLANLEACQAAVDQAVRAKQNLSRPTVVKVTFKGGNPSSSVQMEALPGHQLIKGDGKAIDRVSTAGLWLGNTLTLYRVNLCSTRIEGLSTGVLGPSTGTQ